MKHRFRFLAVLCAMALMVGCGGAKSNSEQAAAPPAASSTESAPSSDGVIAIEVTEEGFVPASVTVQAGQPVKLVVTRKTDKTCATDFVMKEHNINQPLPLDTPVEITFTPAQAGELEYACAMNMYKGKVIVR